MAADSRDAFVLGPGRAPTPFTAGQIRDATTVGKSIRRRVDSEDAESFLLISTYLECDADGATLERSRLTLDGEPLGEPQVFTTTWLDLQRHASFPAADTTIESMDVDGWREMMDVNALGFALACKHAIPHMRAAGGGSIVNISSQQAIVGANIGSAYAASKAAIIAITRMVATQCGRDGIRCNAVAPGLIGSTRIRHNTGLMEAVLPHVLLGRVGEPEDVADLICYLASGEAAYITGQLYNVDGGYLAHMPAPG